MKFPPVEREQAGTTLDSRAVFAAVSAPLGPICRPRARAGRPAADGTYEDRTTKWATNQILGHDLSSTCGMCPRQPDGLVRLEFRVRNVRGLCVVDANTLPRILEPFSVLPMFMLSEKGQFVIHLQQIQHVKSLS
ncbi:hypothetical protein C8A03DRAFT_37943 [Achaetomium macrosporum]|uniref:Glucose-methanol-choline oxidoreductase C-terminal domain-containing protein n=1 Tax=Achaetomium macrosporum TaxID=79813 RepID=A0AAN7C2R3_9PEZI|nr:hypothetical protein C8A03DRAFT_37943 [Achaetomium macrosporum]